MVSEINFMVGGEAGQGVQTVGFVLAKTMARAGLFVFADQDYESRVRGGHNFFRVRVSDSEVGALAEKVDVLIALNQETVELHQSEVKSDGVVIFDQDKIKTDGKKLNSLGMPVEKLAVQTTGNKVMVSSVATGAAIAAAGYDFELLTPVLREQFARAGEKVAEDNVKVAKVGYDQARQQKAPIRSPIRPALPAKRMLLNGNEAIALGAMAAGLKFMAAYPMTPTTSIMEYIADKGRRFNIVVVQPEDEIAAINMAIGAAFAGVRSMTATSGSGFALMVEGYGLAGITETPVVIVLGQRPGPAVGLPTRTEQGELRFAIFGGTGEFPRAVLAPISIEDCFYLTVKAFNLAEKYQMPVIILTDQHIASSYQTVEKFDLSQVKIDRGLLLSEEESNKATDYKRHRFTESGISPRALPMIGKSLVVTDSDEHDETGHLIEDAETRTKMVLKRLKKLDGLRGELSQPTFHEVPGAETVLVGWGSTYGAIQEAAYMLSKEGVKASVLQLNELSPFPREAVASALGNGRKSVVIENNATGQLAYLIRAETGLKVDKTINKFDGRPFSPEYLVKELKKEVALSWSR